MSKSDVSQGNCPIARVMELLGEGWTLLILREAFLGTRRFNDFERELGVARNILSIRLKKLVEAGLLERKPSASDRRVVEYRLSDTGKSLFPVLVALTQWAGQCLCDDSEPVRFIERASGDEIAPVTVHNRKGEPLGLHDIAMVAGPGADKQLRERYERVMKRVEAA